MTKAIQNLIENRYIEEDPAADAEIASRWRAAVISYDDSRRGLSPASQVTLAYQGALQGAIAVVRAAGYRLRSSAGGHHYLTFATVAALEHPVLSPLARGMSDRRRERHDSVYHWNQEPGEERATHLDAVHVDSSARQFLTAAHAWRCAARPSLATQLEPPPQG
ncbi:MAG: hypothetical protein ACJ8GN_08390 [Longimicrobiaceae bacterium]